MRKTRAERAKSLEEWADRVEAAELRHAGTEVLGAVAAPARRLAGVESDLTAAVGATPAIRREQEA